MTIYIYWVFPLENVILHSSVSLPEGTWSIFWGFLDMDLVWTYEIYWLIISFRMTIALILNPPLYPTDIPMSIGSGPHLQLPFPKYLIFSWNKILKYHLTKSQLFLSSHHHFVRCLDSIPLNLHVLIEKPPWFPTKTSPSHRSSSCRCRSRRIPHLVRPPGFRQIQANSWEKIWKCIGKLLALDCWHFCSSNLV